MATTDGLNEMDFEKMQEVFMDLIHQVDPTIDQSKFHFELDPENGMVVGKPIDEETARKIQVVVEKMPKPEWPKRATIEGVDQLPIE